MFIQRKNYLSRITRMRVSEGRNLENGLRLDRNEKVDNWEKGLLVKIFSEKPDYFLSVYPESSNLYKKIANFHNIEESQLMLTSGIDGGLKSIFEIMTEPGDLVGVASPTYAMYKIYANLFQVNLEEIEYTEDLKFNYDSFDAFLSKKPTAFFLPNPNQPIESSFTINELRTFAKKTLEQNCLFIIDEAYHMFGCDSGIDLIKEFENIVITRTFSKGFGVPSIRLGYMISNSENMNILSKTRLAHESNSLTNAVAEYLIDNYEIVKQYNESVIASRDSLKKILKELDIQTHGSNGNYLLLDMKEAQKAKDFVSYLKEREIYVKGPWSAPRDKYITITIGPAVLMDRFVQITKEFLAKNN
jgi:histidinol-phosphate aminotransferase